MTGIKISVDRLQVGNYVKLPLSWKDHPFLFSSFLIKTNDEIDLIRRLGVKQVIIFPDKSETGPKPVQSVETTVTVAEEALQSRESELAAEKERRIEQLKQYRRGLQRSEKAFERSLSQLRNLMSKLQTRPLTAIKEAQELVDGIVSQLLSTDEMVSVSYTHLTLPTICSV